MRLIRRALQLLLRLLLHRLRLTQHLLTLLERLTESALACRRCLRGRRLGLLGRLLHLFSRRLGRRRRLRFGLRDRSAGLFHRLLHPGAHRVHAGVHHRLRLIRSPRHVALRLRHCGIDLFLDLLRCARRSLPGLLRGSQSLAGCLGDVPKRLLAHGLYQIGGHCRRLLRLLLHLLSHRGRRRCCRR